MFHTTDPPKSDHIALIEDSCFGMWMTIGRSGFLGVESGGGPENQDEKMDRGYEKISDMMKYVKIVFTAFQKPQFAHLFIEQPWFALPTETCSCLHVSTMFSIYKDIQLGFSLKVKPLGNGPL